MPALIRKLLFFSTTAGFLLAICNPVSAEMVNKRISCVDASEREYVLDFYYRAYSNRSPVSRYVTVQVTRNGCFHRYTDSAFRLVTWNTTDEETSETPMFHNSRKSTRATTVRVLPGDTLSIQFVRNNADFNVRGTFDYTIEIN